MEVGGIYSISQQYIFKMEHPQTHTHTEIEKEGGNKLSCSAMQKQLPVVGHQQHHHQQQRNGLINIDNRRRMHRKNKN